MKRILLSSALLLAVLFSSYTAQAQHVEFFEGTWDEVQAYAKKTGRPIFVDFYTDWCHWCKVMDKETFQNSEVANYVGGHYVAWRVNAEQGEGIALARDNRVQGYPTIGFFDYTGKPLKMVPGFQKPDPFLNTLQKYFEQGANPEMGDAVSPSAADGFQQNLAQDLLRYEQRLLALSSNSHWQTWYTQAAELGQQAAQSDASPYAWEDFLGEATVNGATESQRVILEARYTQHAKPTDAFVGYLAQEKVSEAIPSDYKLLFAWAYSGSHKPQHAVPHVPMRYVNDACRSGEDAYLAYALKAYLKYLDSKPEAAMESLEQALAAAKRRDDVNTEFTEAFFRELKRSVR